MNEPLEAACREFRCPTCAAEPDEPCVTLTRDTDRREVHVDRLNRAVTAGRVRYQTGRGWAVTTPGE